MAASRSDLVPSLTLPPNPPALLGQRNPMTDSPKVAKLKLISVTIPRLRN